MRRKPVCAGAVLRTTFFLAIPLLVTACLQAPELEEPEAWDYETRPILINNADWGVIPLPNNFLNPVKQAEFVYIPGVPAPESAPTGMALPIVDETAAAIAQGLGYSVTEDSDLTKSLIAGMNRLNGWVTSFAPKIPFSMLPDYDSITPFDDTNGAAANLFFLDITDPTAPVTIMPDKYYRVINYARSESYPYYLSLRFAPEGPLQPPKDFEPGHTYAVVVTGINPDTGIKSIVGKDEQDTPLTEPVVVDNTFLIFAAPDRECPAEGPCDFKVTHPVTGEDVGLAYIGSLGNPVNSVLEELPAVQEAEGARQITNFVLKIWEQLDGVKDVRTRDEVVAAFQWTTTSNPMPMFFDATAALLGSNPVLPSPADYADADGNLVPANAKCDPAIGFGFKVAMNENTVTTDSVMLFKVTGDETPTLTAVEINVTPSTDDTGTSVLIKAKAALDPDTRYLVVATNKMTGVNGWAAVDETYFGLTRTGLAQKNSDGEVTGFIDTPLLSDDGNGGKIWNSPNLDSRLDTLILNWAMLNDIDPVGAPILEVTEDMLTEAADGGFGIIKVLTLLEELRAMHKPLFDALVLDNKVVETREDIVLGWTFTTGACN